MKGKIRMDNIRSMFTNKTPGCSILVSKDNKVLFEENIGLANLSKQIPISSQTSFRTASITKTFTAMGILLLVERKIISLDDPLLMVLPNCPEYAKAVTIQQLLTHTSGIPDHEKPLYKSIKSGQEPTTYDVLTILQSKNKLLFPAGSRYLYSETGYVLLALVIENISKQNYRDFLKENIFTVLDMQQTFVMDKKMTKIKNNALGYRKKNNTYELFDYDPLNYIVGNEGIYSSACDLMKWSNAWFSEVLIKNKLLQEALSPVQLENNIYTPCGFSWFIDKYKGKTIIFHDAFWVGFNNIIMIIPEEKISCILLSNTTNFSTDKLRVRAAVSILKYLNL